jgi:hypothetical protein
LALEVWKNNSTTRRVFKESNQSKKLRVGTYKTGCTTAPLVESNGLIDRGGESGDDFMCQGDKGPTRISSIPVQNGFQEKMMQLRIACK